MCYFKHFDITSTNNYFSTPVCPQVDLSEKPTFWKALKPPAKDKCGELLTSLCYHPSNSILTLTLLKARNLKAKDINGKSGLKYFIYVHAFFPTPPRFRDHQSHIHFLIL